MGPNSGGFRVLIADDESSTRRLLEGHLTRWGYRVRVATCGEDAWAILQDPDDAPSIALLDWMMPGIEGPELCRRIRSRGATPYVYAVLLTGRDSTDDLVSGLESGADDYLVKPFQPRELRSRLLVAERIVALEQTLAAKVAEAEQALAQVKILRGFLPICIHCKRIRNDRGYWEAVEAYIAEHTDAVFSHGLCDECLERYYPEHAGAEEGRTR